MSHHCQAILFRCMDFRLTEQIHNWLKKENLLGDCDIVSVAGSGQGILIEENKKILLEQISASIELHQINTVILMHHSACGAYKLAYNFTSAQEEKDKQLVDMDETEKIIRKKFSNLKVRKIWAQLLDDHGKQINFIEV